MSVAKAGDAVQVHYTGKLADGEVFDSSEGREPLGFSLGSGNVIPGFENAILGMQVGEAKDVVIPVNEAYGERHEQMTQTVPRPNGFGRRAGSWHDGRASQRKR